MGSCVLCYCLYGIFSNVGILSPLKNRQFISSEEAIPAKGQHTRPCSDCPLARNAIPGWLEDSSPEDWKNMLHGEARIDCHVLEGAQCAGAGIYRTNVCKRPRNRELLVLPQDKEAVFVSHTEFLEHHEQDAAKIP